MLTDLLEWWVELSPKQIAESRQQSQVAATPLSQHRSFLNQLCLRAFLPWFQADYAPEALPWPHPTELSSIWEVVNGMAIALNNLRVVLIPTDDIDGGVLTVPQEWIDIPGWAADYYLAIQISLDEHWLRAWGYTTYNQLKHSTNYDDVDRTYGLNREFLAQDFNAFWVTYQLCPEQFNREAITPIPTLSDVTVERFIQQLSSLPFPRLALPFEQWAELIAHDHWRQRLYQQRLSRMTSQIDQVSSVVNLGRWFQNWVETGWQSIEEWLDSEIQTLAASFRAAINLRSSNPQRVKQINFAIVPEPQSVMLLVALTPEADERMGITIQIHPVQGQEHVPAQLTLELHDHSDQVLQVVRSRNRDDFIQLPRFICPLGTYFSLHMFLENHHAIEEFIVRNAN